MFFKVSGRFSLLCPPRLVASLNLRDSVQVVVQVSNPPCGGGRINLMTFQVVFPISLLKVYPALAPTHCFLQLNRM